MKERERAWDLLATAENHPQVQSWLREAETLQAGKRSSSRRRLVWASAALLIVTAGLGIGAWLQTSAPRYETNAGEQRDVLLTDGSKVTLNTDTALTVRYTAGRRFIELARGEALFSVKHDPARPFEVAAGGTVTRALGTEFNVDLRRSKVTVSVLEGSVRVAAADADITALAKGQALEFERRNHRTREAKADIRRIDAWRTRRLEFSDTPLGEAVEEFNRYSTSRVIVGTPELAQVRVSGVFQIGDTEGFLFSLQEALHLEKHESGDEIVLMRPAP